jgi:hypothetical protein
MLFEIIYISGLNYTWTKLISSKRNFLKNLKNEMIFGVFGFAVK